MKQRGNITVKVTWQSQWSHVRGNITKKSGIATVTGKTSKSRDFLLLSVHIQIGSMFPQPNYKSHPVQKKQSEREQQHELQLVGVAGRPEEGR